MNIDVTHIHTGDDVTNTRLALMSWREHMEDVEGGIGFRTWRVVAAGIEAAITERAVELGIEQR